MTHDAHDAIEREKAANNGVSPTFERIRDGIIAQDDGKLLPLMAAYLNRYHSIGNAIDDEYILTEIICDAAGEIDIYAGIDTVEGATQYTKSVQKAFAEARATESQTGTETSAAGEGGGRAKYF